MPRVVFVSTHTPPDRWTEALTTLAMIAAVVGAGMAGWNSGGIFWALLYAFVTLITFPFLLTFCTILLLAFYPFLAWPGSFIADQLGWTVGTNRFANRVWLQRFSVIILLIPIFILLERNAITVMGVVAGVATFSLVVLGMLIALPALLMLGLFVYALTRSRVGDPQAPQQEWQQQPDLPKLPPER